MMKKKINEKGLRRKSIFEKSALKNLLILFESVLHELFRAVLGISWFAARVLTVPSRCPFLSIFPFCNILLRDVWIRTQRATLDSRRLPT
jgi:hypothetical protein